MNSKFSNIKFTIHSLFIKQIYFFFYFLFLFSYYVHLDFIFVLLIFFFFFLKNINLVYLTLKKIAILPLSLCFRVKLDEILAKCSFYPLYLKVI